MLLYAGADLRNFVSPLLNLVRIKLQIERHIMKAVPGGHNLFVPGMTAVTAANIRDKFTSLFSCY